MSLLVDLEARWENLRICQPVTPGVVSTLKELHQKQKAYEAFFAKLVAYNKEYRPAHVPELLLNNAPRPGAWCWKMRDLQLWVQHDAQAQGPVHLLDKAYRWADRLADRTKKVRITRSPGASTVSAAIRELEELAKWCDNLARVGTESWSRRARPSRACSAFLRGFSLSFPIMPANTRLKKQWADKLLTLELDRGYTIQELIPWHGGFSHVLSLAGRHPVPRTDPGGR